MAEVSPSPAMVDALSRVVSGLTAFVLDFDGPRTAHIGGSAYTTLCSHGIKEQGEPAPSFGQQEAVEQYAEHLRVLIAENRDKQLAWRTRPKLECDGDPAKARVYSRLVFI